MISKVNTKEAIGMTLAHDVTRISPGEFKGPRFRKGHVITEQDIPQLLELGKEHVYVLSLEPGEIHEDEAGTRIAKAMADPSLELTEPSESRVDIKAKTSGLLKINVPLLGEINSIDEVIVATLHNNSVCHPGMRLAATRIIPLFTAGSKVEEVETLCQEKGKVIQVKPFVKSKVGLVITGNEVYNGLIEDKFGDVIAGKLEPFGASITHRIFAPDDTDMISQAMLEARDKGSEVIIVCGGMSVDPDDVTPQGIRQSGAKIVSYGAPVVPGTKFLYAQWDNIPVLGAPACVIYDPATVLDLVLPRVLAGEQISYQDVVDMGHGGLCLGCSKCTFPVCPFGK
ncbi:MAG: molybdopterin-binding protein [Chloroflexota bacterium]